MLIIWVGPISSHGDKLCSSALGLVSVALAQRPRQKEGKWQQQVIHQHSLPSREGTKLVQPICKAIWTFQKLQSLTHLTLPIISCVTWAKTPNKLCASVSSVKWVQQWYLPVAKQNIGQFFTLLSHVFLDEVYFPPSWLWTSLHDLL